MNLIQSTLAQITAPRAKPVRQPRLPWEDTTRWTSAELAAEWGVSHKTAYKRIREMLTTGSLIASGDKKYQTLLGHIRVAPSYRFKEIHND